MVKTLEARGARDIVKHALETTGQIFRYTTAHGYAKRNPATDIRPWDILKKFSKDGYADLWKPYSGLGRTFLSGKTTSSRLVATFCATAIRTNCIAADIRHIPMTWVPSMPRAK